MNADCTNNCFSGTHAIDNFLQASIWHVFLDHETKRFFSHMAISQKFNYIIVLKLWNNTELITYALCWVARWNWKFLDGNFESVTQYTLKSTNLGPG